MNGISAYPRIAVTPDGTGIVSHVGTRLLADMAAAVGLNTALVAALDPICAGPRLHAPGRVLLDVALTLADGGDCLSDLAVLGNQESLFGPVASVPTAYRAIHAVDKALLARIRAARAAARARAWTAGAAPKSITLDFDATLLTSHSEKASAGPNYKGGFGFHPLGVWLDETGEALGMLNRPGNAGSGTAADHIEVLEMALAQLPVAPVGIDPKGGVEMAARADSAGASHDFVDALRAAGISFSIGFPIDEGVRLAILAVDKDVWIDAVTTTGEARDTGAVAEITHLLDLSGWGEGTRAIVRREEPHPGAQFNLFDPEGFRHQVFITDSKGSDITALELGHRGHARVEDRIRAAKAMGLENLPFRSFEDNAVWVELVAIATDLVAWTQLIALEGDLATAEPKKLRYRLLHTAARVIRSARQTRIRISADWPWATELAAAFGRVAALAV